MDKNKLEWREKIDGNEYTVTFFGIYEICRDDNKDRYHLRRVWGGNHLELNKEKDSRLSVQLHKTVEQAKNCMQECYDSVVESVLKDIGGVT